MFQKRSYKVFAKTVKGNIVDAQFSCEGEYMPKGYFVLERGFVSPEVFFERKAFFENFKEEYMSYEIYHYIYKNKKIRVKTSETIEAEKRAIDDLFESVEIIS